MNDKRHDNPGAPWKNPKGPRVRKSIFLDPLRLEELELLKEDMGASYGEVVDEAIKTLFEQIRSRNVFNGYSKT